MVREEQSTLKRSSWLSLVAETAGVSGAGIARIFAKSPGVVPGNSTVFVQVIDRRGRVIGAARQSTRGSELKRGLSIDVGMDLNEAFATSVRAWVQLGYVDQPARTANAPSYASVAAFEPLANIELNLHAPDDSDGDLAA